MTESKTKPPKKETVETLMEWMSQKLDEYLKESRESRIKMEEERKASEKERKERDERIAEERKERDERSEKEWADFRASMKAMQKEMGGIGESNGDMAETYFYNSFDKTMQFAGQKYDAIDRNLKRKNKELKLQGEYDIILYNCSSVAIIETKYKARKDDVEDLLSY
ncbi:MAG: hypothetical protein LBU83_00440, partial [Bacteroidales bacterium]|nr:hypothetical protein [Bacteroidales bacterium]